MLTFCDFHYQKQQRTDWHQHRSGQLYYPLSGTMMIETDSVQWLVTPGTLAWFPPDTVHRSTPGSQVSGINIYFQTTEYLCCPAIPHLFRAGTFIPGLLERLRDNSDQDYCRLALALLAHEIAAAPSLPHHIVLPQDRRARAVAIYIVANPDTSLTRTELAGQQGLSERTLSRLFRQQTGLSFSQWRQQTKLVSSLEAVLTGERIEAIAENFGYANTSTYIAAFRQHFGRTPAKFRQSQSQPDSDNTC